MNTKATYVKQSFRSVWRLPSGLRWLTLNTRIIHQLPISKKLTFGLHQNHRLLTGLYLQILKFSFLTFLYPLEVSIYNWWCSKCLYVCNHILISLYILWQQCCPAQYFIKFTEWMCSEWLHYITILQKYNKHLHFMSWLAEFPPRLNQFMILYLWF